MRKSHVQLIGVAVLTLGLVVAMPAAGALEQEAPSSSEPAPPTLNPVQQEDFDSWPAEQKTAYAAWPSETKTYYWSLSPERQALFWRLSDEDKIALTAMTGPERDAAWNQIEARASSPPSDG